jgi:hypothetical protein
MSGAVGRTISGIQCFWTARMRRAVWNAIAMAATVLIVYLVYVSLRIEQQSTRDECGEALLDTERGEMVRWR